MSDGRRRWRTPRHRQHPSYKRSSAHGSIRAPRPSEAERVADVVRFLEALTAGETSRSARLRRLLFDEVAARSPEAERHAHWLRRVLAAAPEWRERLERALKAGTEGLG